MKEAKLKSRPIEIYPSKGRFWIILILGFITVLLGVKLFSLQINRYTLGENSSKGFLLGWGGVIVIAIMIEMMSLPKKMKLKNLKKYIIMFCIYFIVAYGVKYFEPETFIKVFGTFSVILGITMLCYSLHRLIIKRPSIVLSEEGILIKSECNYYGIGMIYWNEIEEVFVYNNYFKRALGIKVYNMKEIKRRQSIISKINSFASGHVSILLGFLEGDNDNLESEFMRFFEEVKNVE